MFEAVHLQRREALMGVGGFERQEAGGSKLLRVVDVLLRQSG